MSDQKQCPQCREPLCPACEECHECLKTYQKMKSETVTTCPGEERKHPVIDHTDGGPLFPAFGWNDPAEENG